MSRKLTHSASSGHALTVMRAMDLLMGAERQAVSGCGTGLIEVGRGEYVGMRRRRHWIQSSDGRIHAREAHEWIYATSSVLTITRTEAYEIVLARLLRAAKAARAALPKGGRGESPTGNGVSPVASGALCADDGKEEEWATFTTTRSRSRKATATAMTKEATPRRSSLLAPPVQQSRGATAGFGSPVCAGPGSDGRERVIPQLVGRRQPWTDSGEAVTT